MKCTFKTWEFYYFVLTIVSNYFGRDVKEHDHHKLEGDFKRTQIKKRQMFDISNILQVLFYTIVRLNYARFIWIDISSICSKFSSYLLKN